MALKLDIKVVFQNSSSRVKALDVHPTEPWLLSALYSGKVQMWNYNTQVLLRTFDVCELPVRCTKFVSRKHWVLTGSDDTKISIFNCNNGEFVHSFEAHDDYLRSIAVHPTLPIILTCSDDCKVKKWTWDPKWSLLNTYEGHSHYVMRVSINPKDPNMFASVSLDQTLCIWNINSNTSGSKGTKVHAKGVNAFNFNYASDKPYIITGADDFLAKIWDYQSKTCVQTLQHHTENVSDVLFHPILPLIFVSSEDSTVSVWHSVTYRCERVLRHNVGRIWCMALGLATNSLIVGGDDGFAVYKIGHDDPCVSLDMAGNIVYSTGFDIYKANVKLALKGNASFDDDDYDEDDNSNKTISKESEQVKDGEPLMLMQKLIGTCEMYPLNILHASNGRYFTMVGSGEYIIYSSVGFRSKKFGQCSDFEWSKDSINFAISRGPEIVIHVNFEEKHKFNVGCNVDKLFGGELLAAKCGSDLVFYDWNRPGQVVARIDVVPISVIWNDSSLQCVISTSKSFFILQYQKDLVEAYFESKSSQKSAESIEETSFEVVEEYLIEAVTSGIWIGEVFICIDKQFKLCQFVGGDSQVLAHLDTQCTLLGYLSEVGRLVVSDRKNRVMTYKINKPYLEFQTAIIHEDHETAQKLLPSITDNERSKVARFLEKQGCLQQAIQITTDNNHKFDLAIKLGMLEVADGVADILQNKRCWSLLCNSALKVVNINLALKCMWKTADYSGLVLLGVILRDAAILKKVQVACSGNKQLTNISFLVARLIGTTEDCTKCLVQSNQFSYAAVYDLCHSKSFSNSNFDDWKTDVAAANKRASDFLASPTQYANLFSSDVLKILTSDITPCRVESNSTHSEPEVDHSDASVELCEKVENSLNLKSGEQENDDDEAYADMIDVDDPLFT